MSDRSSERGDRPSKLQKVWPTIREEGVPELTQRKHIAEAARASLEDTGHGPIVEALGCKKAAKE